VDSLSANAEHLLQTAAAASGGESQDLTICVTDFNIRVLDHAQGWSLPALAAETGAKAVYRVERRQSRVLVEAWSRDRTCILRQERLPKPAFAGYRAQAIRDDAIGLNCSVKDLSPRVRNS